MRFLCLHGRGTNSKIFEMQTAAIRYELADHHIYDFVEGKIPWEIEPAFKEVLPGQQETFALFDEHQPDTAVDVINDLDDFYEAEGPYDGVFAFSQAVGVVATWIVRRTEFRKPSFKCAVFLSGPLPCFDYAALTQGRLSYLYHDTAGELINIPTVHVWGTQDKWAEGAIAVSQICRSDQRSVVIHRGGHEIPGSGSAEAKAAVTEVVHSIRRAVLTVQDNMRSEVIHGA